MKKHVFSLVMWCAMLSQVMGAETIWVEGEDARSKKMSRHGWYSDAVKKEQLSGAAWITNFTKDNDGEASYSLRVATAGTYALWVRANHIGAALSYRLQENGEWLSVDTGKTIDSVNIANDGKPDMRFVAWMRAGDVMLPAGNSTISWKMHSANNHHGGIDCFVLTTVPFTPNGIVRPGQKLNLAAPGWWSFEPDADTFGKDSLLNLRFLNERVAGESGFIQAKGDQFLLGNGKPVRFWGINSGHGIMNADDATVEMTAARFAKLGINLVRMQGGLFDRKGNDPNKINVHELERLLDIIQIFKRHGIYTHVSHYFPLWMDLKDSDGIAQSALGQHPFALTYFEPRMQAIYQSWVQTILTTKHSKSGKTLMDEPAVACFEIINEDSMFFWTFNEKNLGAGPLATLEKQYAAWLIKQHGSLAQAIMAWGKEQHQRDDLAGKRVAILDAFNMTRQGMTNDQKRARMRDQIAFLATTQRDWYARTTQYVRSLGFKAPVSASNWTTADNMVLGGVERWTYTATDVIDKHGYVGGKHEGEASGHSVREGHVYEDMVALHNPENLPISYMQITGKPHLHSEIAWNKPNRYIADGNLLTASYAALQGVDGYVWFAAADGNWLNNGNGKWTWMMPGEIGQSPAAALQYRRGDVQTSAPVIRQVSSDAEVLALKDTGIAEGKNSDFRIGEAPTANEHNNLTHFDPLSYFVGRVERSFAADAKPITTQMKPYIDRKAKRMVSVTGELTWNYGDGLMSVNTPCSQAVTGFLQKAGPIILGDVQVTSSMEYGTIHVISLDDLPIKTSKRMLIQAFSEERMYEFASAKGTITNTGRVPINVRDIAGTITFANTRGLSVTTLDLNGYARAAAAPVTNGAISLLKDALYTIVIR